MLNRIILIGIVSFSLLSMGCTNTKAIIAGKDAQITEQHAQIEKNNTLIDNLRSRVNACNNELGELKLQCNEQLSKAEVEREALLIRERQLRYKLSKDIALKNVEIERLTGQLTIKVLDRILFRSGSIVILPEGQEVLTRIAESLLDVDEYLRVEGHTDDVPIGSYLIDKIPTNWELSVLRATSVVHFLEKAGIQAERLSATGHSKFKPVAENTSDENRQLNRRVEIVLLPKQ